MSSALAKEKGGRWTVDHISALWHVSQLMHEDLPQDEKASNEDLAKCVHVRKIFGGGGTRVPDHDPAFYEKVCKRSSDANGKHPVLIVGSWRQGKSSLVNSLCKSGKAETGRHQRTTQRVELHEMWAGSVGHILLADTPGLEPDREYDLIQMYREALGRASLCPDVLTDLIILVIAGNPQGISSLSSEKVMSWIRGTYASARGLACRTCTLLPILTHGEYIHPTTLDADKQVVWDRLRNLAACPTGTGATGCATCAVIMEPVVVCNANAKEQRQGWGIEELRAAIIEKVKETSSSDEFRLQWSRMLTSDLRAQVRDFLLRYPHEETEVRLFHRTVEAVLATYGTRASNIDTDLPQASWHLLDIIERKLRKEESWQDRVATRAVMWLPCSPREVCPYVWLSGGLCLAKQGFTRRAWLAQRAIGLLGKVH